MGILFDDVEDVLETLFGLEVGATIVHDKNSHFNFNVLVLKLSC